MSSGWILWANWTSCTEGCVLIGCYHLISSIDKSCVGNTDKADRLLCWHTQHTLENINNGCILVGTPVYAVGISLI